MIYAARQVELSVSTQSDRTAGADRRRDARGQRGDHVHAAVTNYLEEVFGGQAYMGRVPTTEDGAISIATVHRETSSIVLQEAAATIARAERCLAAIETPYGWYAGGLMGPRRWTSRRRGTGWLASRATCLGRGTRTGASVAAPGPSGRVRPRPLAPLAATSPSHRRANFTGDFYAVITAAGTTGTATGRLHQASGSARSDAIPLRRGIYRMANAPADITRLFISAAPPSPVTITIIYGTRIQGEDA